MNINKKVGHKKLTERILKISMVAVLSFAMLITGFASSFYAYAEDESIAKQTEEGAPESTEESVPNDEAESEETQAEAPAPEEEAAPAEEATQTEEANDEAAEEDADNSETATEAETETADENAQGSATSAVEEPRQNEDAAENATENADNDSNVRKTKAVLKSNPVPTKSAMKAASSAGEARIGDKTYETVQEAVEAALDGEVVELIKDIAIKTTIEIIGKSITISDDGNARVVKNEDGTSAPLFTVRNGASLTFNGSSTENLKLQGGTSSKDNSATVLIVEGIANIQKVLIEGGVVNGSADENGAVNVRKGGVLNMSDGVIENTTIRGGYGTAAVVVQDGAHFEMSGGEIRNNTNYSNGTHNGGGVVLSAWNKEQSTMNLSGGKIHNNTAHNGGGIYLTGSSKLNMTGGAIEDNTARNNGGGICVAGLWASKDSEKTFTPNDEFIMNGGSISNNRARLGGGMYVNTDRAYLNAGYIENNTASTQGGGIYLSQYPEILHIKKAVITENTARLIGGGIWSCPTGDVEFKVTDGVAIYNNEAADAGDDMVMQGSGWFFSESTLTLPDRMLGGGAVSWYKDGATYAGALGSGRGNIPRFDPENPGKEVHLKGYTGAAALKTITSEEAIKRANEEATLFIRYNTAARGGGIGTNGGVTLPTMDYKDWKLVAEKKWEDVEDTEDKEVKVFLKIGDQILDSIILNKDNEWKGEFTGLPDPASLEDKLITIVEGEMVTDEDGNEVFKETSQYVVRYERIVTEDDGVIYVLVTNSPLPPEEPETPDEPEEPDTPEEPEETTVEVAPPEVKEDNAVKEAYTPAETAEISAEKEEVKIAATSVKSVKTSKGVPTGDSNDITLYIAVMLIAMAAVTGIFFKRVNE